MKKTVITIGTAAVVIFTSTFTASPITVSAERNIDSLKTEQRNLNKDLSKVETKIKDILLDIQKIHKEIVKLEKEIKENEKLINEVEGQINEHEKQVEIINDRIQERNEILKNRISSFQEAGGNVNFLEVILGAKSPLDFISRVDAVTTMTSADQDLINEQEEDLAEVEIKLSELDDMKIDLEEIDQILTTNLEEEEMAKEKIAKKEKELKKEKNKLETDLQSVNNEIASFEAQIRASMDQTVSVANRTPSNSSTTNSNKQPEVASYPQGTGGGSVISRAKSVIGTPYRAAGKGPGGFDCSGFVSWAYGGSIPSSTASLRGMGTKVSTSNMQTGDLVFFNTVPGRSDSHVGIYIGGGQFIASNTTNGVEIRSLNGPYWKDTFKGHVRRVK